MQAEVITTEEAGCGHSPYKPTSKTVESEQLLTDQENVEETPLFDTFVTIPPKQEPRESSKLTRFFEKLFKLLSYPIFGGLLLGGVLVSKACLMILVNSAKPHKPSSRSESENLKLESDVIRAWSFIMILIMLLVPEILTIIYSLYRILMKHENRFKWSTLLWGGLWEFLHSIGEAILIMKVLPYMDATVALLIMPLIAIIPTCIHCYGKIMSNRQDRSSLASWRRNLAFAISAVILQVVSLILCFSIFWKDTWFNFIKNGNTYIWSFAGIILTSCRYWENYITEDFAIGNYKLGNTLHNKLDGSRFKTSFIFSFMKCIVLTAMAFLIFVVLENTTYCSNYILDKNNAYSSNRYKKILSLFTINDIPPTTTTSVINQKLWYICLTQVCCSFIAFCAGRLACSTMIQRTSYTIPLVLVTPILVVFSAILTFQKQFDGGSGKMSLLEFVGLEYIYDSTPSMKYYLDWNNVLFSPGTTTSQCKLYLAGLATVGLLLGWTSLNLLTSHLWSSSRRRLQRMEVLFVKPLYGGVLIDQVLMLNRRRWEQKYPENKKIGVPHLFLCATMWHETEKEMTQILTSIMRFDKDKGLRKEQDNDFYHFQVHVMFDDAMERNPENPEPITNRFVQQLCKLIPIVAKKESSLEDNEICLYPVIYSTPYGGRLEFILPCGNLMIIHLKDKNKIRHGKRWSQCMYMYYILGYLQKTKNAFDVKDMFLLALDGDIDFQPDAVLRLLDRMQRNPEVGAACGRIYPIGNGPVVWFQKFEYAVGHWLQKTAEHVLGCVLCSPGCFSLFRAAALENINVVHTYTTKPSKAYQYVQWNQGEDRWLCTLLLKQGWKIEYSALSLSYTFAPENFKEFYNQRRRWTSSTMANIFDIILDAKRVINKNNSISYGYIAYQTGLMASSILGPATVVMTIQGAYQYVFEWSATVSLIVSLLPVIIFIILCYVTSADTQVLVAGILTVIYALIMMTVAVDVIGSIAKKAIFDPNNLFMILLIGLYGLTGILHPQEMHCLLHGMLYYLCVPSAFIFLLVYSLINMNNISWGTREVKKSKLEANESKQNEDEENFQHANKMERNVQLGGSVFDNPKFTKGYCNCGLGYICQCAFCINSVPDHEPILKSSAHTQQPLHKHTFKRSLSYSSCDKKQLLQRYGTAKEQQISGVKREDIEESLRKHKSLVELRSISETEEDKNDKDKNEARINNTKTIESNEEDLTWLLKVNLEDGILKYLDEDERNFWIYVIEKYLYPMDENKKEQKRIKDELKDLRNNMTGAYFFLNGLWIVLNFALQQTIKDIAISFTINGSTVKVNPVQFFFLSIYLVILFIQFTCMLVHRWLTAVHLLSVTSLKWNDSREKTANVSNIGEISQTPRPVNRSDDDITSNCRNLGQDNGGYASFGLERDSEFDSVFGDSYSASTTIPNSTIVNDAKNLLNTVGSSNHGNTPKTVTVEVHPNYEGGFGYNRLKDNVDENMLTVTI